MIKKHKISSTIGNTNELFFDGYKNIKNFSHVRFCDSMFSWGTKQTRATIWICSLKRYNCYESVGGELVAERNKDKRQQLFAVVRVSLPRSSPIRLQTRCRGRAWCGRNRNVRCFDVSHYDDNFSFYRTGRWCSTFSAHDPEDIEGMFRIRFPSHPN